MPRRLPDYYREPEMLYWSDLPRVIWIGFGVAVLIGLVSGTAWIGWKLFDLHVLH
jgi:hypothetical protein